MEEAICGQRGLSLIIRMRDVYSYWLNHPRKEERDMARYMQGLQHLAERGLQDLRYIKFSSGLQLFHHRLLSLPLHSTL